MYYLNKTNQLGCRGTYTLTAYAVSCEKLYISAFTGLFTKAEVYLHFAGIKKVK